MLVPRATATISAAAVPYDSSSLILFYCVIIIRLANDLSSDPSLRSKRSFFTQWPNDMSRQNDRHDDISQHNDLSMLTELYQYLDTYFLSLPKETTNDTSFLSLPKETTS
jgi:hypothetical protein